MPGRDAELNLPKFGIVARFLQWRSAASNLQLDTTIGVTIVFRASFDQYRETGNVDRHPAGGLAFRRAESSEDP